MFAQNARRKRAKALAILNFKIHHGLHLSRTRIADDAAAAKRAWTKFHSALMQTNYLSRCQQLSHNFRQFCARIVFVRKIFGAEERFNFFDGVAWSQKRAFHS